MPPTTPTGRRSPWGSPGPTATSSGRSSATGPGSTAGSEAPWASLPGPEPLLEPEYRPAYEAYAKSPTPQAADALLAAVRPVIDEGLKSYAGGEAASATMRAHAKRLTLEAARRYDPNRAKLRTHLLSHLRGLRRLSERATAVAYAPEQSKLDRQRVERHLADLRDELGREPSDAEIADRAGVPIGRVRKARELPAVFAGGDAEGVPVRAPSEEAFKVFAEGVYHDQNPVDQVIMEHGLGLFGREKLPANEIAKMLNLSPGAISQRSQKLQRQLDEFENFMQVPH